MEFSQNVLNLMTKTLLAVGTARGEAKARNVRRLRQYMRMSKTLQDTQNHRKTIARARKAKRMRRKLESYEYERNAAKAQHLSFNECVLQLKELYQ